MKKSYGCAKKTDALLFGQQRACKTVSPRNRGDITQTDVFVACAQLYADYYEKRILLIDIHWEHIARANDLILQHNLRSHDAIILSCALEVQAFNPVFVVSDRRLLAEEDTSAKHRQFGLVDKLNLKERNVSPGKNV